VLARKGRVPGRLCNDLDERIILVPFTVVHVILHQISGISNTSPRGGGGRDNLKFQHLDHNCLLLFISQCTLTYSFHSLYLRTWM
jgi:hypothetical protein